MVVVGGRRLAQGLEGRYAGERREVGDDRGKERGGGGGWGYASGLPAVHEGRCGSAVRRKTVRVVMSLSFIRLTIHAALPVGHARFRWQHTALPNPAGELIT